MLFRSDTEVIGRIKWNEEQKMFWEFPYLHQVDIFIMLQEKKLCYKYEITNLGNENMGFGFGTHPYFWNGNKDVFIQLHCDYILAEDEYKIPTERKSTRRN